MEDQVIELVGETLEEVRADAKAKTPPGLSILNEKIVADGKAVKAAGLADTAEGAAALAKGKVPAGTAVVDEKLTVSPERKTMDVEAWDEAGAETKAKSVIPSTNRLESIVLKSTGRKGFLGMGKAPNTYSAAYFQPAVYEVQYKGKARIIVKIGERKQAPAGFCQFCGKAEAPLKAGDKDIHYFCSSACSEPYFKAKLRSLMANAFVINASGRDISGMLAAGREASVRDRAYCWSCGKSLPMSDKSCPSCGKGQDIPV